MWLQVLQARHDALAISHFGFNKTMELMSWNYWWPRLWKYLKEFVGSCNVCAWEKNPHHHPHGFPQPLSIFTSLWFSISRDFIINLPPFSSYDSISVVVDCLMKMVHLIACIKTITCKGTTKLFFILFFNTMVFLKISFLIAASVCIQILETTFWTFRCEGEVVINFSPLNRWAIYESIKSWNNAQPIIIKIIGRNFWSWQNLLITT